MTSSMTAPRKSLAKIKDETEFKPWQLEGVRTMARMTSVILADDMGLGKTLQALAVAAIDFEMGLAKHVLVITPASLQVNWAEEIELRTRFTYTVLGAEKVGPDDWKQQDADFRAKQLEEFKQGNTDILIVGYEQVTNLTEWMVEEKTYTVTDPKTKQKVKKTKKVRTAVGSVLNDMSMFEITVVDEAHFIKGPDSQRTKAVHFLRSPRWILCTGSPLLNHVDDLWGLLHRIDPASFPNYYRFLNRYAVYGGYKDKQLVGVKNEAELRDKLATVQIRRLAKDVLDTKEPLIVPVHVELSPLQRQLYDQAREDHAIQRKQLGITDLDDLKMDNAMVEFMYLLRICATSACIEGFPDESYKLDKVVEDIRELADAGHKTVVFTQFRPALHALEARLQNKVPVYSLHGDVNKTERVPIVGRWSNDKEPGPIICMHQVGGVGLNMGAARHMLMVDKLFVPKLNDQSIARMGGLRAAGNTEAVQIREYLCRGTKESRKERILAAKKKVFDTIVETSDWKRALIQALMEEED